MSTLTPNPTFPVGAPFNTTPAASGTFIPSVWSAKLLSRFYAVSTFADVCNTDYEGEISKQGDKVIINKSPTVAVANYTAGMTLNYQAPAPEIQELLIDKGKYFAFQLNDVLKYQAQPKLLDAFSTNAAEQMRVAVDSTCWYGTFNQAHAANKGATAGLQSGAYNLGTDAAPVVLSPANVVAKILEMAATMDEQHLPDGDRYLLIDPLTRQMLFQSQLAKVYETGDGASPVRNGLIGMIDRFKVYVTNNLPRAGAGAVWISGDGSENYVSGTGAKRRVLIAGHRSALTFASQITNMETVRNPNDFGDYIRSLKVFGYKCVRPESLVTMVAA